MSEEKSKDKKENREQQKETPVWEWIIAAVGLILVVGTIGLTLYRAMTEETTPPIIEFSVQAIKPAANGYLVEFRVKNTGNQTAAAVSIEGELKKGAESIEKSSASLAYAPANSVREGGLFFAKNPNEFELNIRAVGYEKP